MIIRVRKRVANYVVVDQETARLKSISFKARGLWLLIMSFPDNWESNPEHLAKQSGKDGLTAVRSALKELQSVGLARLIKQKDPSGQFTGSHWDVYETPDLNTGMQETSIPVRDAGFPEVGKPESRETLAIRSNNSEERIISLREPTHSGSLKEDRKVHPALSIYVDVCGFDPPLYFSDLIIQKVGIAPKGLEHWRAVCETWVATPGWNERQVKKMIDDLDNQREEKPKRTFSKDSGSDRKRGKLGTTSNPGRPGGYIQGTGPLPFIKK